MPSDDEQRPPLDGLRVLVTRPREQAGELVARLAAAGAEPVVLPTIMISDPPDWEPADRAIRQLDRYGWLLLTSVNGVERFVDRLRHHDLDPARACGRLKTVCVGPRTAAAAGRAGLKSSTVAKEYAAEGIIELFAGHDLAGAKILFPRALKARELLPETLRRRGAGVDVVPVYETLFPPESAARIAELLRNDALDLITLTSASTAANLARHCPAGLRDRLEQIPVACIGPITAAAAGKAGLKVAATASEYTAAGLVETILANFSRKL